MAKATTGGSGSSATNRLVRCSTVPSPPSVMQKSASACKVLKNMPETSLNG